MILNRRTRRQTRRTTTRTTMRREKGPQPARLGTTCVVGAKRKMAIEWTTIAMKIHRPRQAVLCQLVVEPETAQGQHLRPMKAQRNVTRCATGPKSIERTVTMTLTLLLRRRRTQSTASAKLTVVLAGLEGEVHLGLTGGCICLIWPIPRHAVVDGGSISEDAEIADADRYPHRLQDPPPPQTRSWMTMILTVACGQVAPGGLRAVEKVEVHALISRLSRLIAVSRGTVWAVSNPISRP